MCYTRPVKSYIHARLHPGDRAVIESLRRATGRSQSQLVRQALRALHQEVERQPSALDRAGKSAGRFRRGPRDLSTNPRYLDEFGG